LKLYSGDDVRKASVIEIWRGIEGCEVLFPVLGWRMGELDELGRRIAARVGVFREAELPSAGVGCWAEWTLSGAKGEKVFRARIQTRWTRELGSLEQS